MPSASYYRAQAKLLFSLSLTTSDAALARRYRLRGQEFLLRAIEAEQSPGRQKSEHIAAAFRDQQTRKA